MSKTTKIKPLFDNVLIEPLKGEDKSTGGIYLPDTAKEAPHMGTVLEVGPGVADDSGKVNTMVVKAGQTVYYKKWGGNEIRHEGKNLVLVEQKDIMAIVE